jgi:hypothetical protein
MKVNAENIIYFKIFEVLLSVTIKVEAFWNVMLCSLLDMYQCSDDSPVS